VRACYRLPDTARQSTRQACNDWRERKSDVSIFTARESAVTIPLGTLGDWGEQNLRLGEAASKSGRVFSAKGLGYAAVKLKSS
jgi:hypothetical protein